MLSLKKDKKMYTNFTLNFNQQNTLIADLTFSLNHFSTRQLYINVNRFNIQLSHGIKCFKN